MTSGPSVPAPAMGRRECGLAVGTKAKHVVSDTVFLSLVATLSLVLYTGGLGFYSDDWAFLGSMSTASDPSMFGLVNALAVHTPLWMRPVQWLYLALLYWLFGAHPLGWHVVNASVFTAGVVLLRFVLGGLGYPRLLALAVPAIYASLPHYSTDRFWVAAMQANLSITLYLLSFLAALRGVRVRGRRRWGWIALAVVGLIGSTLAYEVALPLFILNIGVAWRLRQRAAVMEGEVGGWTGAFRAMPVAQIVALLVVVIFKTYMTITTRMGPGSTLWAHFGWIFERAIALDHGPEDYGLNLITLLSVTYGTYGVGLPRVAWKLAVEHPDPIVLALGMGVGCLVGGYLWRVARSADRLPSARTMRGLVGHGVLVSGLGYAIFLTSGALQLTTTGVGNRTAIAAAIGVAASFVGVLGWAVAGLFRQRLRAGVFCCLVGLLGMHGFVINNTLASFWKAAADRQAEVLSAIRLEFAALPPGSTVIVDGVCPYVGPAVVFESCWDLAGALKTLYRDGSLKGDVVSAKLRVEAHGISTFVYDVRCVHPYQNLIVYNAVLRTTCRLVDADTARRYFKAVGRASATRCPRGHEGHGVPVI